MIVCNILFSLHDCNILCKKKRLLVYMIVCNILCKKRVL